MTDGYRALREDAGRIDLSSRGRIRVGGDDRARLLHAMTTNQVKDLIAGTGCYVFFLSSVGRVLADANVLCFDNHFLLDIEPESRQFVMEHLDKYIIADDVTLEDITDSTVAFGIEGPQSEALMHEVGMPVPQSPLAHLSAGHMTVVRASSVGGSGLRLIGEPGSVSKFEDTSFASAEDAGIVRLEHFFPRYSEDITTANLPQETGITDALHYNKGCYLGQEIVERIRSRGHVNRLLVGLRIEGDEPLARGARVTLEGTDVGEITSAAVSPALRATVGMAYVRINAAKPGTTVLVEGRAAQTAAIKSSRT